MLYDTGDVSPERHDEAYSSVDTKDKPPLPVKPRKKATTSAVNAGASNLYSLPIKPPSRSKPKISRETKPNVRDEVQAVSSNPIYGFDD